MKSIIPALLFASVSAAPSPAGALPSDDPLAKPKASEKPAGPLEKAVVRVARELRSDPNYPATEGAVEFALLLYAESRAPEDLKLAAGLAARLDTGDGKTPSRTLFQVAQAGGTDPNHAEAMFLQRTRGASDVAARPTAQYAAYVQDLFARAFALRDERAVQGALVVAATFFESRTRVDGNRLILRDTEDSPSSLTDYTETLRAAITTASVSGSGRMRDDAVLLARELVHRFWNDDAGVLAHKGDATPSAPALAGARAAFVVWEVGFLAGDRFLEQRGKRALEGILPAALAQPESAPTAALAAARMSTYPVQMVLIGTAADPVLRALRESSVFLFEPRRMLLNLDPATDTARLEALSYPADLAPVLFICVETICSAPIHTDENLDAKVQEILKVAAGVQE